jgi:metal-responsive CopG/Arc/MetJ family transcriptional regulator
MKRPIIHISFTEDDMDLFHTINNISASRHINKSGFLRELIRKSLTEYEPSSKNQTKNTISLSTL